MTTLVVAGMQVRQDADGRFCLNDLHRAAGGAGKDRPARFMRMGETRRLVEEIDATDQIRSVRTTEGRGGGTYVCDDLVYAYAMWINAKFYLRVIRAAKAALGLDVSLSRRLWTRRLALETRDASSRGKAQVGARFMCERRWDLPKFRSERASLEAEMQAGLFLAQTAQKGEAPTATNCQGF